MYVASSSLRIACGQPRNENKKKKRNEERKKERNWKKSERKMKRNGAKICNRSLQTICDVKREEDRKETGDGCWIWNERERRRGRLKIRAAIDENSRSLF